MQVLGCDADRTAWGPQCGWMGIDVGKVQVGQIQIIPTYMLMSEAC